MRRECGSGSGSDANDCVFKIIPKFAKKPRIISFIGAYPGQTMGSLSREIKHRQGFWGSRVL